MKIKVTADSTCDLPPEIIEKYDIGIAPLYIIMDEKPYKDRLEINVNQLFDYVESGKGMTRSNAINISEYQEYFSNWLKDCDAIVHISLSHQVSACNQSAMIAAGDFDNVYVVDSRNLSTGSGQIVLDAAIMAQSGNYSAQEIVAQLELLIPRVEASFVIGTLKYLHLGGRCSGVAALGANLLKLNPCIEVIDGKMDVVKKYRGSFDKIILQYVEDRLANRDDIDLRRVFVTGPPTMSAGLMNAVADKVKSLQAFEEVIVCDAGCVISNHCGPVCIGILFYKK